MSGERSYCAHRSSHFGIRTRAKKRTAPRARQPKPLRCPGQLRRGEPSTDGRSAGVSLRSTSHRPSCPKARRAMPRFRPGRSVARPRCRRMSLPARPVGVARRSLHPSTPHVCPANRPAARCGSVAFVPAPMPLTPTLPKRGAGPFSVDASPEGEPSPGSFPSPGWRCAFRYGAHVAGSHRPWSRGIFQFTGFSPELSRYAQERPHPSTVRAQRCPHRIERERRSRLTNVSPARLNGDVIASTFAAVAIIVIP